MWMKKLVRHNKTTEIGVKTMSGVTINHRRLCAAQENKQACSLFLVSIQGINNLSYQLCKQTQGQTV